VLGALGDCHDGARKSRNSGCCGCVFVVLKVRLDAAGAHALCAFFDVERARRHLFEAFIVVDMIRVVCRCCCVSQVVCFAFSNRLVMRWGRRPAKLAEAETWTSPCPIGGGHH
jgi:hypothetical protein